MIYFFDSFCWYESILFCVVLLKEVIIGDIDVILFVGGKIVVISGCGLRDVIILECIRG